MSLSPKLRDTALNGARQARTKIAKVKAALRELPQTAGERQALADSVGFLFESELVEDERLLDSLQLGLVRLSEAMKMLQSSPHAEHVTCHRAQADLAMALATLYPSTCAMESVLRPEETSAGVISAPPERLTLEIVPEEDERRAESRQHIDTAIGLQTDNCFFTGQAGDISAGGLFVASEAPRSVGTEVTLSFVLPSGYQVTTLGVVRWMDQQGREGNAIDKRSGMGIAFESLMPSDRAAIEAFLVMRPPFVQSE